MIPRFDKNKKGMLHTLEAVIAFLMIIGFITFLMPYIDKSGQNRNPERIYVYGALSNLEKSGKLHSLAAAENLSGIKLELNRTLSLPMKFTVGMSKSNISHGTVYPEEKNAFKYINFTANKSALDSATLRLEYENASDPAIYMNGQEIARHSGNYSGNEESFDISSYAQTGTNAIMLNTSNNATIAYSLSIVDSIELEAPAQNKTITSVGYIVSGNGSAFLPSEIRVYVWK